MSAGTGLPGLTLQRVRERRSRALFHWRAADASLVPLTGQTPTFARASVGSAVLDVGNRVVAPPHSLPAWTMVDTDGDGVRDTLGLLLDPGRTNLCLQSENLGTTWVDIGTPTRSAGYVNLGALALDILGDDSAAALEGKRQVIAFTGNAVKAISVFYRASTVGTSVVRVRDTTAGADRLLAAITPDGSGVPTTAMSTGSLLAAEFVGLDPDFGSRVYRLDFQTTSITAANTNQIELYPATSAALAVANTGSTVLAGVQAEDAPYPSGYLKTTTATVTRARDALSYQAGWAVQDETWYVRCARPVHADASGTLGVFPALLSRGAGTARLELYFSSSARQIGMNAVDAAGGSSAAVQNIPAGRVLEVCAQISLVKAGVKVRLDVGGGFGAYSTPAAGVAAWSSADLVLGDLASSLGNCLGAPLFAVKIAAGALTLDQMRQLL